MCMPYRIAGIDVHKAMLAWVVADVEVERDWQFERRQFGATPSHLRLLAEWLFKCKVGVRTPKARKSQFRVPHDTPTHTPRFLPLSGRPPPTKWQSGSRHVACDRHSKGEARVLCRG